MTQELAEHIANNIKRGRAALRISQALLAERAGLSTTHLAMIELGKRNPSLESLEQIARALSLEPYELLMPENAIATSTQLYAMKKELDRHIDSVFDRILAEQEGEKAEKKLPPQD